MNKIYKCTGVIVLVELVSCVRENYPAATRDKCTPVNTLRINQKSRIAINAALALRIDVRRYNYKAQNFCAYNEPTSTKKYYLLTIFYKAGDHITPTWILLSRKQAVDTQFSEYEMIHTDSVAMNTLIISKVNLLAGIDDTSRNDLINMMSREARQARSLKK